MPHHLYYSCFPLSIIIGATIGANTINIGAICALIGATIGVNPIIIGAILCNIYYDSRLFIYDICAIFYDIGILNDHFEGRVIAKQEFSRITFVFFKKRRNCINTTSKAIDIAKIQHYLGNVRIAVVGLIRKVLQIDFPVEIAGIVYLDAVAEFVKLYRRVISVIRSMHHGIHSKLSYCFPRIIDTRLLTKYADKFRTFILNGILYEIFQLF